MNPNVPVAAVLCFLIIVIAICAIVFISSRLKPPAARAIHLTRGDPFPDDRDRTDPAGDVWLTQLHHDCAPDWLDCLPVAGALLQPQPVEPAAETGEIPALTGELGEDFDEYWAGLIAGQEVAS